MPQNSHRATDEVLIASFLGGDRRAFDRLFDRYHANLMYVAHVKWRLQTQDAHDVVQAVFTLLIEQAEKLRRHGSVKAWLFKAAFRLALRVIAQQRSWDELPDGDFHDSSIQPVAATVSPADMLFVRKALACITNERARDAWVDWVAGHYTQRELADAYEVSVRTIKRWKVDVEASLRTCGWMLQDSVGLKKSSPRAEPPPDSVMEHARGRIEFPEDVETKA
jgi:RNA polymerase sigma factor (sigma-70 family)